MFCWVTPHLFPTPFVNIPTCGCANLPEAELLGVTQSPKPASHLLIHLISLMNPYNPRAKSEVSIDKFISTDLQLNYPFPRFNQTTELCWLFLAWTFWPPFLSCVCHQIQSPYLIVQTTKAPSLTIHCSVSSFHLKGTLRDFPGGPVVKTLYFHCRGHRFNFWSES